jgi:hypothetical protein
VFRFNQRASDSWGMLSFQLLEQAVVTDPLTYEQVVRLGCQTGLSDRATQGSKVAVA